MGLLTRQTREELKTWASDPNEGEFAAFLDDVADDKCGFKKACEDRIVAQGAMLNWLRADPVREAAYERALMAKSEIMAHEVLQISDEQAEAFRKDGTTFDPDVGRDKLRIEARLRLAGKWHRERYGERVKVDSATVPTPDAGLIGFASELLKLVAQRSAVPAIEAQDAEYVAPVTVETRVLAGEERWI